MSFYKISEGEFGRYRDVIIYHEKKFTNKEFIKMYNEAIAATTYLNKSDCDDVVVKMCVLFDFKLLEINLEVHSVGYSGCLKYNGRIRNDDDYIECYK